MDAEQLYDMIETREAWEVFIVDTVRNEKMDPWDIDIVVLADKCLKRLHNLEEFDFRMTGKVVLSAAILLRMKSDSLVLRDTSQVIQEYMEQYAEDFEEIDPRDEVLRRVGEYPELEPMIIRTPQSKVTINDLLTALRKVLKDEEKKSVVRQEMQVSPLKLELPEYNITEAIKDVLWRIKRAVKGGIGITFFDVLNKRTRREVAETFLPVLHLSNEQRIILEQEKMFGPINILPGPRFEEDIVGEVKEVPEFVEEMAPGEMIQEEMVPEEATPEDVNNE